MTKIRILRFSTEALKFISENERRLKFTKVPHQTGLRVNQCLHVLSDLVRVPAQNDINSREQVRQS